MIKNLQNSKERMNSTKFKEREANEPQFRLSLITLIASVKMISFELFIITIIIVVEFAIRQN